MTPKQIKKTLIDKELTISQMARQLAPQVSATEASLKQMLSDMFNHRRWYPTLAEDVRREFGLNLIRPKQYEPKVRLKKVA